MSYTLAVLRAELRNFLLLDPTLAYTWVDESLNFCIREAVSRHSYLFPKRCYLLTSVTAGLQQVVLTPGMDPLSGTDVDSEIIAIQGVELPVGTRIPEDPQQSRPPTTGASSRYAQGWFARDTLLTFTNPASGTEVGTNTLKVYALRTWNLPNVANTIPWDGAAKDQPFVQLIARRVAYGLLAGWQAKTQSYLATIAAGQIQEDPNVDLLRMIELLDREIEAAIKARRQRSTHSRTLDI